MAGEWSDKPLLELCSYINRGSAPAYIEAGGVLVLNQKCVRDQRVSFLEARRTDQERKLVIADRMLQLLDILVNSTGVGTLGRVAQLVALPEPATVDSHVTIVRPDPAAVDPRYLGFAVRLYEREIEALAEGSTGQTELSRARLGAFPVPLAPEKEQRAIAHILGTLDDKIELNRRMSETLERQARALFKSWFVDFDPVRAKAEGRDPGLPQPLANLFPDSFEDSALGEIPKGWEVATLDGLAQIQGGKQLPTEDCKSVGAFPVFGANGIMGYADRATHDGFVIAFGRVGAYCGSVHWTYSGAWINNNASSVLPKHSPEFVLQAMLTADFERMRTGSAQPFIPNISLASLPLVRPPDVVLAQFCAAAQSFRLKEQFCRKESHNLSALRDTLLPKLISGELRVKDAKRFVAEATA